MKTVVGVDRTFNLGPCFVTIMAYKNMSVLRKCNGLRDHPIFLGPVMFHYDGKGDTHNIYFRRICDVGEFTGDVELVFGSDEEKAIINAVKVSFPTTEHMYCSRHIEENARRHMTDTVGLPIKQREEVSIIVNYFIQQRWI